MQKVCPWHVVSEVLKKGEKRVPLPAVQATMGKKRKGLTKSYLPDVMVSGIPAKEMEVGEVSATLNSTYGPIF